MRSRTLYHKGSIGFFDHIPLNPSVAIPAPGSLAPMPTNPSHRSLRPAIAIDPIQFAPDLKTVVAQLESFGPIGISSFEYLRPSPAAPTLPPPTIMAAEKTDPAPAHPAADKEIQNDDTLHDAWLWVIEAPAAAVIRPDKPTVPTVSQRNVVNLPPWAVIPSPTHGYAMQA